MTTQTLWQTFRHELDGFIRGRVVNAADAEDLRQQVYLHIHRHLLHADPPEHVRGWVYRIARNAITDYRRRRAARLAVADGLDDLDHLSQPHDDDSAVVEDVAKCLLGLVDHLAEPYQSAVRWVEVEGMTQQSAANRAGVTLPGMKARVQRGRTKLRESLLACCDVEFDARNRPIDHTCRAGGC